MALPTLRVILSMSVPLVQTHPCISLLQRDRVNLLFSLTPAKENQKQEKRGFAGNTGVSLGARGMDIS